MNHLGKYTNSVGHLIMSIICIAAGLVLVLFSSDPTTRALGVSLITTVAAFWFVSGARNSAIENIPQKNDLSQNDKKQ